MADEGRELFLMRHGKSSWSSDAGRDFDRPLAPRGKRDAPRMGAWLKGLGVVFSQVVSSPAKRARGTATKVAEAAGLDPEAIRWEPRIYGGEVADLLEVLADCPGPRAVLLVGHNPGLDDLLAYLCGVGSGLREDGKVMTTAAVARLRLPENWRHLAAGCGVLVAITRPADLTP